MQHLATIVFQDDQYEQYPHGECRHGKEVNRYHLADMVAQEGAPGLVRRPSEPAQDARYSALGDGDPEHLEFVVNPGCAPQRIGCGHLLNESAEFCGGAGATSTPALRLGQPSPEFPEPFALPTDNRVCLDVHQRMSPIRPQAAERDPKYPVAGRQQGALPFSLKRG